MRLVILFEELWELTVMCVAHRAHWQVCHLQPNLLLTLTISRLSEGPDAGAWDLQILIWLIWPHNQFSQPTGFSYEVPSQPLMRFHSQPLKNKRTINKTFFISHCSILGSLDLPPTKSDLYLFKSPTCYLLSRLFSLSFLLHGFWGSHHTCLVDYVSESIS